MEEKMEDIKDISLGPMPPNSPYCGPVRLTYVQNGKKKFWDFVKVHEAVATILFNTDRKKLMFVKQFRPSVFFSEAKALAKKEKHVMPNDDLYIALNEADPKVGMTIELCAGIVDDPNLSLEEHVKKEVLEECGYDVPLSNFERVLQYKQGVGVTGDKTTLFYGHMTDSMKVTVGGGNESEGELIQTVEMSIPEARQYVEGPSVQSPGGFLFGIMWFLNNKAKAYDTS